MRRFVITVAAGALLFAHGLSAQSSGANNNCSSCAQKPPTGNASSRTLPGSSESIPVGRIENLMPIGILAALGCETCAAKAVAWALEQGSSTEEVERAIRTVEAMQKLDCFRQQFGPEAAGRLQKPLTAARTALREATQSANR